MRTIRHGIRTNAFANALNSIPSTVSFSNRCRCCQRPGWFDRSGRSILFRDGDKYFRWKLPLFTAPAEEVPFLAKLYAGRFVDETDGLSTNDKHEFINNHQRYRQAWFASLGKEVPPIPALPVLATAATKIDPGAVVPLEIALKSIGKSVTVEFAVEHVGRTASGGWVILNSKKAFKDEDNFEVSIRNGVTREKEFGLKQNLVGRTVRATGKVSQYQGRTQIVIEKKSQLEILPATPTTSGIAD